MKPKVFIGSSKENERIANSIHVNIQNDSEVTPWKKGFFELSSYTLDTLINKIEEFDFGIFILSPGGKGINHNVILELGLFMSRLKW